MRVTNKANLPAPLVALVSGGERVPVANSISVTTLIRPPQMVALERQHWADLEEDAADRIWASYGTLMHLAIERAGYDDALVEEKLSVEIDGWTLHGTPDLYEGDGTLTDFKFASVWSFIDGVKPEYEAQLNCYAYLLGKHGFPVKKLEIVAMYRDWTKRRAGERGYPPQQVAVHAVPLWDADDTLAYILGRLYLHREPRPVPCSDEERWYSGDVYAITKSGNKRATKLCASEQEANDWIADVRISSPQLPGKFDVNLRPGENRRCDSFCSVASRCPQYAMITALATAAEVVDEAVRAE